MPPEPHVPGSPVSYRGSGIPPPSHHPSYSRKHRQVRPVSRRFRRPVLQVLFRGTKRNANVASARRVAIYILREVTGMSMEEIGREFSGRDHSTIVYSLKTMERDMKNDQHLRETVSDIIKNVKA